jgi:hypothetical protein
MNITKIIGKLFDARLQKIDLYDTNAGSIQEKVLMSLVRYAKDTEWGKKYDYKTIRDYEDFRSRLPIQTYEDIKGDVERLRQGEQNILWPSEIRWFAKSSGTTNDKSKFLPVSKEGLHDIHYRGGGDAVALYLRMNPESRFFSGKGLILGGSHSPNLNTNHSLVGDLSAILMQNISPLANLIRVPSKKIALMSEWESKIKAIAASTIKENVTNLSGVPSWFLVLIKHILQQTGKTSLEEVWPNLGGILPRRRSVHSLCRTIQTGHPFSQYALYRDVQCFGGIFRYAELNSTTPSMLMMIDYGVFYEFIPLDEVGTEHPHTPIPSPKWSSNKNYAMVISTIVWPVALYDWRYRDVRAERTRISSISPEERNILSMPSARNLSWTMQRKVLPKRVPRRVPSCSSIRQLPSLWTAAPNVAISGSSSSADRPDSLEHFCCRPRQCAERD